MVVKLKQAMEGLTGMFSAQCGALARGKEVAQDGARSSEAEVEKLHANVLRQARVRISMGGRGRWMDNALSERLWRSLKYECVCLHAF